MSKMSTASLQRGRSANDSTMLEIATPAPSSICSPRVSQRGLLKFSISVHECNYNSEPPAKRARVESESSLSQTDDDKESVYSIQGKETGM